MLILVCPSVIVPNTAVDDGEVGTDDKVPKSKRAMSATAPRSKVSLPISQTWFILKSRPKFLTGFTAANIVFNISISTVFCALNGAFTCLQSSQKTKVSLIIQCTLAVYKPIRVLLHCWHHYRK